MALLTSSWILDFFSICTALVAAFLGWMSWCHGYWKRKGILTPPTSLLFGNSANVFFQTESFGEFIQKLYYYFRSHNKPHGGFYFFFNSAYMPVDPDIIKAIMQNDFDHFVDRGFYSNEDADPLSAHLVALEGAKWRSLRNRLTPTFTSGKMKMMFETLIKCSDELIIETSKSVGKDSVDIKDILGRFTADIIGSCAFGIDCNSLKNPDNEVTKHLKLFFVVGFWDNIKGFLTLVAPSLMKKIKVKVVKPALAEFFMRLIKQTVNYREKNNIYRRDFMHLLLQLKNRGQLVDDGSILKEQGDSTEQQVSLTFNELAAQAFIFFLAGFETSSSTMTFCLFELASNKDIQEKVRNEINEVLNKYDGKLCYDATMDMHYMEKVINETLRKYPSLPALNRICTKEYRVPGTDLVLEKGTQVSIPVIGLHQDPEYYPNPGKFDPERFSEENKRKRHPYTFLPFGEGPRICIGLRFGMMQTKVGLATLLKNYRFSVSSKTKLPLEFDPRTFFTTTKGGIWLDVAAV